MKIIVNGQMIDTEKIYRIGEINCNRFEIESFDGKILDVENIDFYKDVRNSGKRGLDAVTLYGKFETAFAQMRQDIIKIWSDNQTTFPTFKSNIYASTVTIK